MRDYKNEKIIEDEMMMEEVRRKMKHKRNIPLWQYRSRRRRLKDATKERCQFPILKFHNFHLKLPSFDENCDPNGKLKFSS